MTTPSLSRGAFFCELEGRDVAGPPRSMRSTRRRGRDRDRRVAVWLGDRDYTASNGARQARRDPGVPLRLPRVAEIRAAAASPRERVRTGSKLWIGSVFQRCKAPKPGSQTAFPTTLIAAAEVARGSGPHRVDSVSDRSSTRPNTAWRAARRRRAGRREERQCLAALAPCGRARAPRRRRT